MRTKLHKFSVAINAELLQKARYIVYALTGQTLAGLARTGLRREIQRLERKRGLAFPELADHIILPRGRPRSRIH